MTSLRARLLTAASLVLAAFFVLTGAALDSAFRDSVLQAQRDKLEGLVYTLLAALGPDDSGNLTISSADVPDRRLQQPASGLQAALYDEKGNVVWQSAAFLEFPKMPEVGVDQWHFEELKQPSVFTLSYGVRWLDLADDPLRYTVVVFEDATSFKRQLTIYRRELWLWLAASAGGLLLIQYLVLRWGLSPLRRLVRELHTIERGDRPEIQGRYPDELQPLTQGLNAMIRSERSQQTRYRNALGDLAHSLKTPLAVLHGFADEARLPAEVRQPLREQVGVMQQITDYQLRKAATAGRRALAEPVAPAPVAEKITRALAKVYADKRPRFQLDIAPALKVRVDGGDMMELIGNLADNACKYGNGRVRVRIARENDTVVFAVEDDGPGFPEDAEELLRRGVRADTQKPGQGIGLAAVFDLVQAYEGRLELGKSELGGGRVMVRLPA
jgi:two-component system sensor histidine kinase PhoQ